MTFQMVRRVTVASLFLTHTDKNMKMSESCFAKNSASVTELFCNQYTIIRDVCS